MKRKYIKIINAVLIAALVIAAANIVIIYYNYGKADSTYQEIRNEYVSSKPILPNRPQDQPQGGNDSEDQKDDPQPPDDPRQPDEGEQPQPEAAEVPIGVDFEALLRRNADVVGWLYCPDTVINYPVVKGSNNDQYLHADLDGKYLYSGTLFADYRNGAIGEDANYIIYGHNMNNGSMFGTVLRYKTQDYYDQHPTMYYLTPEGDYIVELFAGLIIRRDDAIYLPTQDDAAFFALMQEYQQNSTFKSDVKLQPEDDFIVLSTCSYEFDNARYVVVGLLIPV